MLFCDYGNGELCFALKEDSMIRATFVAAIAALAFTAFSGASNAAPIAPLPATVASDVGAGNLTQVYWHHHWHHHHCWWRHGYRHCW